MSDRKPKRASRWRTLLYSAFWIFWALRGLSFFVDLGGAERFVEIASFVALGAVLADRSFRQFRKS